ncbi:hypothetical protein WN943_000763 [Citrus x changshan-huyou]
MHGGPETKFQERKRRLSRGRKKGNVTNSESYFHFLVAQEDVEQLFEIHRRMDHSELRHTLGYVIYSVKQKLKQEQLGLPGDEIKKLKSPDTGILIRYYKGCWLQIGFLYGNTLRDLLFLGVHSLLCKFHLFDRSGTFLHLHLNSFNLMHDILLPSAYVPNSSQPSSFYIVQIMEYQVQTPEYYGW